MGVPIIALHAICFSGERAGFEIMGMKYDPGTDAFYMCVDDYPKESEYHFENAYYIRYNIDKALYALNMISSYSHESEPSCFLCHTNVDLLFEACGLIHNRFCEKERMSEAHRQQIRNNVFEYGFDKDSYPLLSEKDYRNFIEHIDERGRFLIREDVFHGTFNVVYAGMDEDLRQGLTNPDKQQNNTQP